MKRYFAALFTLAALAASFVPASAGLHWKWKEVRWQICNANANGVWCRDTAFAHVGPVGLADTSSWVTLERCAVTNVSDSLVANTNAYWAFVSDTAATYTATLTALTVATDVGPPYLTNASGNLAATIGIQAVANAVDGTGSKLVTTGDKIVAYPIILGAVLQGGGVNSGQGLIQAFPVRCRITAGVGAQGLAQSRVFIVYQTDEP